MRVLSWPVLLFTVLALMADLSMVSAFRATSPRGKFEDRIARRAGGVIAVAPRNVDRLETTDPLRVGWRTFRARYGGAWEAALGAADGPFFLSSGPTLADIGA